jgi:cytidine deaminase
MDISPETLAKLESAAREAAKQSYCRYSNFPVGAAVLASGNREEIFSGCNVENASYGLANCAERTAIFKAVSSGYRKILAVVVYTPTQETTSPCGACRQVINEFGPKCAVINICDSDHRIETTLDSLLPDAFGPENLT